MIAEQQSQQPQEQSNYAGTKYYQFYTVATIVEHVIDCFHTIVSDETNPYHPPLSWLTRKNLRPPQDQLFLDLFAECSESNQTNEIFGKLISDKPLSSKLKSELEKLTKDSRRSIVTRVKDGCCPLFKAAQLGHYKIVRYLLDFCDADIEQRGCFEAAEDHHVHSVSPLWIAAVSGQFKIVELLLEKGAKVNSISDTGSTPLRSVCFLCKEDEASENGTDLLNDCQNSDIYFKIVELLVRNGADVQKSNYSGGSCLMNSVHNHQLTKYILEHGADVNASDLQSKTALHYAIQQGRLEVTKLLLSYNADPMLCSNNFDDALQLSCLCGQLEIFEFIVAEFNYPKRRLIDAYKLLGSSILELKYDLSRVRELWQEAINLSKGESQQHETSMSQILVRDVSNHGDQRDELCDIRRLLALGDKNEFENQLELDEMSADEFRVQSLLISERILGTNHRELIQRLLYRGNYYLNSLRPDKCINLWIYALILRLKHESMFHFESIFTAQALTKLFLDLASQQNQQQPSNVIKWHDVYDVLSILVAQLDSCRAHLAVKPSSCLHEDIFDMVLGIILKLLLILNSCKPNDSNEKQSARSSGSNEANMLIGALVNMDPRTSEGSSLLHGCIAPAVIEINSSIRRQSPTSQPTRDHDDDCQPSQRQTSDASPLGELMKAFVDHGLNVDTANKMGLSALQVLCLQTSIRPESKRELIARLVSLEAHLDRRALSVEHGVAIRQTLRDAGIEPNKSMRLTCLAAKCLANARIPIDERVLCKSLGDHVAIH